MAGSGEGISMSTNRDDLKAKLLAQAEAAIDTMLSDDVERD